MRGEKKSEEDIDEDMALLESDDQNQMEEVEENRAECDAKETKMDISKSPLPTSEGVEKRENGKFYCSLCKRTIDSEKQVSIHVNSYQWCFFLFVI